MLLINIKNSNGSKTEPCGTPLVNEMAWNFILRAFYYLEWWNKCPAVIINVAKIKFCL